MSEQHIMSAFDRDLQTIQGLMVKMGAMVEEAIRTSVTALETSDLELAEKTRLGDKAIDALEEEIKHETARVIALRAPTAIDLRTILSVMTIGAQLERCGDLAKNIAKRTPLIAESTEIAGAFAMLRNFSGFIEKMVSDALDAYIQRDVAAAEAIIRRDEEADETYNTIFRSLLTHMMEDQSTITACMHLHFIAKNLERIGDHATGIAEQTIYRVSGELPDEDRPKVDVTDTAPKG
ncbi:phosphate signaling complex protein PhoU [Qingshengfaniella alkalisoli]|uniref:Phosphate-specific transport system accessory protein PhoU n=1 Tax=Qingshengfaniella alkalisoli TaxID=2599296 RepID=A0A5B8JB17_9RHOB|nr:phosphate signaling complex protein PhoU [Qingshengfaniella alkalisoli]QDY71477.1 phosphate signaling complex protein PhoU [Qingshengfaniella alkalisoli]